MKLWVDDLRPAPAGWHWARTVNEAIRILASQDVTEVHLDHDIVHTEETPGGLLRPLKVTNKDTGEEENFRCTETFEAIAWFIYAVPYNVKKVTLHTGNIAVTKRIKGILEMAGVEVIVKMADGKEE